MILSEKKYVIMYLSAPKLPIKISVDSSIVDVNILVKHAELIK